METHALKQQLTAGAKIKLGERYCEGKGYTAGEVITLVNGIFEYDNGLYTEDQECPAVWCEHQNEFDSIYHLFGNALERFADCEVLFND